MLARDSKYYRKRLERDHPVIFRDLVAGKYRSIRQAAAAAGLIHLPTRLQNLKREWKRATAAERRAFIAWAKSTLPASSSTARIASSDGRLTPRAIDFLKDWLKRNRLKPGNVMQAIGGSNHDYRMFEALNSGKPLPTDVVTRLSDWMKRAGYKP